MITSTLMNWESIQLLPMPEGCPVSIAAASVPALQPADTTKRFVSAWGLSPEDAIASCGAEMAERLSAQVHGDETLQRATAAELDGAHIAPSALMLIGREQYRGTVMPAGDWEADALPMPWNPGVPIDWLPATDAVSGQRIWTPAGLALLGHRQDAYAGLTAADTNGLAAGKTLEDAAIAAFLELVERDAVAIWWYNRLRLPAVNPADIADHLVPSYVAWSAARHRSLRLIDLTHDLGIPVIAAVAHDLNGRFISLGLGAGRSIAAAARHAVGELALFECNIDLIRQRIAVRGEGDLTLEARRLLRWWREIRLEDCPYLIPIADKTHPVVHELKDLASFQSIAASHQLRFVTVDLTRPQIGIPVMRVIVPGLRPMLPRFAPGRLYDVPVRCGMLSSTTAPSDLNAIPMIF